LKSCFVPVTTNLREQLTVLLDLKQKQANVSEARSSRIQAQQANEQANETTRQGTIIMLVSTMIQEHVLDANIEDSSLL
jgi:hypothetical protein